MSDSVEPLAAPQRQPVPAPVEAPAVASLPGPTADGPRSLPVSAAEEVDVWWGAYSGWTLMPSMILCLALTALIAWGVWELVPRGWVQLAFIGLGGALWVAQGIRFAYHIFGVNYRLTSRRLFRDRGFIYPEMREVRLADVARVGVKRNSFEKLMGVGKIYVYLEDPSRPPFILDGVRHPEAIADIIREWKQLQ